MKNLHLFTIFESDGGRPRCTGIMAGDKVQIYDLYRPGAKKLISVIKQHKKLVRDFILEAQRRNIKIITTDFKNQLRAFELPLDTKRYNVYDLAWPDIIKPTDSLVTDNELVKQALAKMAKAKVHEWHKIYANAAVVYQDLENRGILNNYALERPIWSQKVFSGRSKTTGFNIQGFIEPHLIASPNAPSRQILIHFDWISADIRIAALLSGDTRLEAAFLDSDPYTYMMNEINANSRTQLNRDECKLFLLQSINSMDFTSIALTKIYPQLGEWIARCKKITSADGGYLETILGRRFRLAHAKNALAVLNGVQQGSVAHAMQCTIRKVWELLGHRLLMEGHDSLVVAVPSDVAEIKATIRTVADVMAYPFAGILPSNPLFPLKISIGDRWRMWKLKAVYRQNGVIYVQHKAPDQPKGDRQTEAAVSQEDSQSEGSGNEEGHSVTAVDQGQ